MHNLVFFASGSGTNFQSVIDAITSGSINANITGLISDRKQAGAIKRARLHNIPVFVIEPEKPEFSERLLDTLRQCNPDLIILAGYLKKIPDAVTREYRGRIINIHPSLLPKYGGKGYYGLKVHEAVLRNGETETGCTVHYVDEVYDNGTIIDQRTVHVDALDTPKSLAKKVLKEEHELLPKVIKLILTEIK
ncbi:MAG: phosphoribosylglycinamide formyltransferase [Balneolaceae bacterium]